MFTNRIWIDHIMTNDDSSSSNEVESNNKEVAPVINEKAYEYYERGMELVQRGHYDQGLGCISKAIELDPRNVIFRISKGNLLKSLDRPAEAIKFYDETIEMCPQKCADAYFGKGHILIEKHRFKDALNCFNKSIELDASKEEYHYSKGNTLKLLEKYSDAIKSLDEALKINPSFACAYQAKGEVLSELKRFDESLVFLSKACDLESKVSSLISKGNCLFSMHRFQEAIQCFDLVLKLDPYDMLAMAFKAKCQSEMNRKKKLTRK